MHLLVLRFSAMGDVALIVPVIKQLLKDNPQLEVTVVSKAFFHPLFEGIPNLRFHPVFFNSKHKGLFGLFKLYREIKRNHPIDYIIDLHNVLRSWIFCLLYSFNGTKYFRIDKGRKEKHKLTRKNHKIVQSLPHTCQRYQHTFANLPLKISPPDLPAITKNQGIYSNMADELNGLGLLPKSKRWIGLAPFSKHLQKQWPLEKIHQLINSLQRNDLQICLFGGPDELPMLENMANKYANVINIAGNLSFTHEIQLISRLDLMITMDSFNMHLASIAGIKVVSIWGATHRYAGFGPLGENEKFIVEKDLKTLGCRPCSVFGNKTCWRGDLACLNLIGIDQVMEKIALALASND